MAVPSPNADALPRKAHGSSPSHGGGHSLDTRSLRMRIGVPGRPAAMSALSHQPGRRARENAGGGVRGGFLEGGCLSVAVQEPDLPDSTDRVPRGWRFSLVSCGGGP
ncbi:hypothetical protein P7K49_023412 [Saguinus oedipus]|uniref:Uncharacterized protein n=1 Tax=Saguinus oedipus TaxID=9490 RepID=A0ABQ9ULN4_SAGOE|nr:hypothetical protein P7K49_023412 [Saguinus oedipus]